MQCFLPFNRALLNEDHRDPQFRYELKQYVDCVELGQADGLSRGANSPRTENESLLANAPREGQDGLMQPGPKKVPFPMGPLRGGAGRRWHKIVAYSVY